MHFCGFHIHSTIGSVTGSSHYRMQAKRWVCLQAIVLCCILAGGSRPQFKQATDRVGECTCGRVSVRAIVHSPNY